MKHNTVSQCMLNWGLNILEDITIPQMKKDLIAAELRLIGTQNSLKYGMGGQEWLQKTLSSKKNFQER